MEQQLTLRELEKCLWKHMSQDEDSTTFCAVRKGDQLYGCYDCLGYTNTCGNYTPLKNMQDYDSFDKIKQQIIDRR